MIDDHPLVSGNDRATVSIAGSVIEDDDKYTYWGFSNTSVRRTSFPLELPGANPKSHPSRSVSGDLEGKT